ncbi:suppressor-like protein, partial [Genlisea aurea]
SSASSVFSLVNSRPPEDTVFYSVFPDCFVASAADSDELLRALHAGIVRHISPIIGDYVWQHQPFSLFPAVSPIPHIAGQVRFGDNIEDEWFVVYLLFEISKAFPDVSIRVWDSDGEFLLIETAFHLPKWLNPDTSINRVFIRRGRLHIIPKSRFPSTPSMEDSLRFLVSGHESECFAPEAMQLQLSRKIGEYPERAYRNVHKARVTVPLSVAWVLKHEPSLVSLAVEGFYDRDIDSMKYASKMERFLPQGKEEEMVEVMIRMPRAMYAQLVQQKFQAPSCFPMPDRNNMVKYLQSEMGMKISCGFEMMYQLRKKQGEEGKGSTWAAFKESLEKSGYFEGLLPGSREYRRKMENVDEYFRNSSLHHRSSEALNAPVKHIDETLALPCSAYDFNNQELSPSDDDSWLYSGGDEINAAIEERQKEMELYDSKRKKKQEANVQNNGVGKYDLGEISQSMQAFVETVSSYEGAEIPEGRNVKEVDFEVDQFMEAMEKFLGHRGSNDDSSDIDLGDELLSDLNSDDSEGDDVHSEDMEDGNAEFVRSYSRALTKELKATTLGKTFARANKQQPSAESNEESCSVKNNGDEMEELSPLDVDFNIVKNLLDSYSSQEGMAGPASNLLGLMGFKLPDD